MESTVLTSLICKPNFALDSDRCGDLLGHPNLNLLPMSVDSVVISNGRSVGVGIWDGICAGVTSGTCCEGEAAKDGRGIGEEVVPGSTGLGGVWVDGWGRRSGWH